jgi:hypothetical protein
MIILYLAIDALLAIIPAKIAKDREIQFTLKETYDKKEKINDICEKLISLLGEPEGFEQEERQNNEYTWVHIDNGYDRVTVNLKLYIDSAQNCVVLQWYY